MRNILSNELVAKDQSFPRLNESRKVEDFLARFRGARSVLNLDNYVEKKGRREREREERDSDRGEVENGKRIRRLLRRTLASLPSGLRRGGIQVRKDVTWKFIGTSKRICLSFHMKSSRVQQERKHQMIFIFWKGRVVNPLWPVIVIHSILWDSLYSWVEEIWKKRKCLLSFW